MPIVGGGRKKRVGRKTVAKRAATRKRNIKQLARKVQMHMGEKKYFLTSAAATSQSYSGAVVSLSDVAQGDTDITRDGDQLTVTSLEFNYNLVVGDVTNLFRVIIFQWLPGTTPTSSNIIFSNLDNTAQAPLSPYVHDGRYSFRIMYDKLHNLDTNNNQVVSKNMLLKIPKSRIQYGGGGTNGENKIYVLFVSDSAAVTHPTYAYAAKLNFRDS